MVDNDKAMLQHSLSLPKKTTHNNTHTQYIVVLCKGEFIYVLRFSFTLRIAVAVAWELRRTVVCDIRCGSDCINVGKCSKAVVRVLLLIFGGHIEKMTERALIPITNDSPLMKS